MFIIETILFLFNFWRLLISNPIRLLIGALVSSHHLFWFLQYLLSLSIWHLAQLWKINQSSFVLSAAKMWDRRQIWLRLLRRRRLLQLLCIWIRSTTTCIYAQYFDHVLAAWSQLRYWPLENENLVEYIDVNKELFGIIQHLCKNIGFSTRGQSIVSSDAKYLETYR